MQCELPDSMDLSVQTQHDRCSTALDKCARSWCWGYKNIPETVNYYLYDWRLQQHASSTQPNHSATPLSLV